MSYDFFKFLRRKDSTSLDLYDPSETKALLIDTATADTTKIKGQATSLKILEIYANQGASTPSLGLRPSTNDSVMLTPSSGRYIFLNGTVKYGTKTATGDVACDGYIEIKDSAGNTVKLMTTA